MRIAITTAVWVVLAGAALAQTEARPTLGQCRDASGRTTGCTSAAAATDAEAVPLAAKAKVIDEVAQGRTPHIASAAPKMVPARCRDGAYDVGRTRGAACADHTGPAPAER